MQSTVNPGFLYSCTQPFPRVYNLEGDTDPTDAANVEIRWDRN